MKKLTFKLLAVMSSVFIFYNSFAQNLVSNPSFEEYSSCPDGIGQISYAIGWEPCGPSTEEYFHFCGAPDYSVPENWFGYQYAATGKAYAALFSYNVFNPNTREAICIQLTDTSWFSRCLMESHSVKSKI